jgi:hypothetical protein
VEFRSAINGVHYTGAMKEKLRLRKWLINEGELKRRLSGVDLWDPSGAVTGQGAPDGAAVHHQWR